MAGSSRDRLEAIRAGQEQRTIAEARTIHRNWHLLVDDGHRPPKEARATLRESVACDRLWALGVDYNDTPEWRRRIARTLAAVIVRNATGRRSCSQSAKFVICDYDGSTDRPRR